MCSVEKKSKGRKKNQIGYGGGFSIMRLFVYLFAKRELDY